MVSKRRTKRRRNRQLKGGEGVGDIFRKFADTVDSTKAEFDKRVAKGAADLKGTVAKAADGFGKAADGLGTDVVDAKRNAQAAANKAAEDASRDVHAAVIHAKKGVDTLKHNTESLPVHAHNPDTQNGGRKRRTHTKGGKKRRSKHTKGGRKRRRKHTKRRKKRRSRQRRRK